MTSTLVHTTATRNAAAAIRDVAARTAAAARVSEGLARRDPAYGTWLCQCMCRRCIPLKGDCGGCVDGGCDLQFVTHAAAASHYSIFGIGYDPRRGPLW